MFYILYLVTLMAWNTGVYRRWLTLTLLQTTKNRRDLSMRQIYEFNSCKGSDEAMKYVAFVLLLSIMESISAY